MNSVLCSFGKEFTTFLSKAQKEYSDDIIRISESNKMSKDEKRAAAAYVTGGYLVPIACGAFLFRCVLKYSPEIIRAVKSN